MAWDMARSELFRIADDAAKLRYHENYLRQHGKDFEELVRAATEKSDRLKEDGPRRSPRQSRRSPRSSWPCTTNCVGHQSACVRQWG